MDINLPSAHVITPNVLRPPMQAAPIPPTAPQTGLPPSPADVATNACFEQPGLQSRSNIRAAVERFNAGTLDGLSLMRMVTANIVACRRDWRAALACIDSLAETRDPYNHGLSVAPNQYNFNAAIKNCVIAGRPNEAAALVNRMLDLRIMPNLEILQLMMQAYGDSHRIDLALNVFGRLLDYGPAMGILPDTAVYNQMLGICEKAVQADPALAVFERMLADGSVAPDATTYQHLVSTCQRAGRLRATRSVFRHALDQGPAFSVFPNTLTFNRAIVACGAALQPDDAANLFRRLLGAGPQHGVAPDICTYHALISAYALAGRLQGALDTLRHLQTRGAALGLYPNALTYSVLMAASDDEGASALLDQAIADGLLLPSLGLDAASDTVDLRQRAVQRECIAEDLHPAIHPGLAKTIFQRLLEQGRIGPETRFVVGMGDSGPAARSIRDCMRKAGWTPPHRVTGKNNPDCDAPFAGPVGLRITGSPTAGLAAALVP